MRTKWIRALTPWLLRLVLFMLSVVPTVHGQTSSSARLLRGADLAPIFERQVQRRLTLSEVQQEHYAQLLASALQTRGLGALPPQYFLLVDRHPKAQAAMLYWKSPEGDYEFVGASPCSSGRPGEFEHFVTPLGVFEHALTNLDFRAEGTLNRFGIRGYGVKGMRVYDFGWVEAERGWGAPGRSAMRLQVHSTDPDLLEPHLGAPHSKGCVRIPAALNELIDQYGLLDAAYEEAVAAGRRFWVLRPDRTPTPWPGRYLVVVESYGG